MVKIRETTSQDRNTIRQIHLDAFGESEGPIVSNLAGDLLGDETALPLLSLGAEADSHIVGNIIFSSVKIDDADEDVSAYILAPLAVIKRYQQKGIGKSLITQGLAILKESGADLVFVYGDPNYYSQTGFEPAIPHHFKPPYPLEYPDEAWMVQELSKGALDRISGTIQCALSLCHEELW